MGIYKELDLEIEAIARNNKEKDKFRELVTQHFEGRDVWQFMPPELRNVLIQWEQNQIDK